MRGAKKIKQAFNYLVKRAEDGVGFTKEQLILETGWTEGNLNTNISKRLGELVREGEDGLFYCRPEMLRVRLSEFEDLFRQKQRLFADYTLERTSSVLVYEFFMPLSREDRLRESLDSLFFTDTITQRIKELGTKRIVQALELPDNTPDEKVIAFVTNFINSTIGGYSLYHVNGRFRADSLASRSEVAERPFTYGPYLVDETTAIVRFILPINTSPPIAAQQNLFEPAPNIINNDIRADNMSWLFLHFFAEAVIRMVKKEDEIWLLESGLRSALYRWIRKDD